MAILSLNYVQFEDENDSILMQVLQTYKILWIFI